MGNQNRFNLLKSRIKKAYYLLLGYYPVTIYGMKFRCDAYHFGHWRWIADKKWEPHTFRVLSRYLAPSQVYCDIGAWIGGLAIYAARKCRQVYCFEPDPVAYEYLLANIRLNKLRNMIPFNLALTDYDGTVRVASYGGNLGDTTTSQLRSQDKNSIEVPCMAWLSAIKTFRLQDIDFIKMDIEGGEFTLIPSMKRYLQEIRPILYLSTHAPYLDETQRDDKMRELFDVLSMYKECYTADINTITINRSHYRQFLNRFQEFLFIS